jgi:tetratricopeptide (TPR) repeat protein
MKTYHKLFLIILYSFIGTNTHAQTSDAAKALVQEGITLNDAGKYPEAIDKYKEAIKLSPDYSNPYYEIGYSLFSSGKGKDAISYLEKYLILAPKAGGGYDLLGSIYDDDHQTDKAIDYYKRGIEADPEYQRLHYNLAIAYYRKEKYTESEASAVKAIKLDPKHASSMRVYAMSMYRDQKFEYSLLAWCSFIILEPQTARAADAYKNIRNILNHGISKTSEKSVNISISDKELGTSTLMMQMAVLSATLDKKNLSSADSLSLHLKSVFSILAETATHKSDTFYANYLAKYFGKLAQTNNMNTFGHLMSLAAKPEDNQPWFKEHTKELADLNAWIKTTERSF